jgi:hypothetical protein
VIRLKYPVINDPNDQRANKNLPALGVRRTQAGIVMAACVLVFLMLERSAMAANNVVTVSNAF